MYWVLEPEERMNRLTFNIERATTHEGDDGDRTVTVAPYLVEKLALPRSAGTENEHVLPVRHGVVCRLEFGRDDPLVVAWVILHGANSSIEKLVEVDLCIEFTRAHRFPPYAPRLSGCATNSRRWS